MALIIIAILLVVGLFVGLGFGEHKYTYTEKKKNYQTQEMETITKEDYKFGWKLKGLQLLAPLGALVLLFGMFTTLDATEVAVVTRFGRVQEVVSEPGFKIKSPLDKYNKYSTEVQEIRYDNVEHGEISSWANTGQDVFASLTIQWKIDRTNAQQVYEKFGGNLEAVENKLSSLVVAEAKGTLSQYGVDGLIANRAALSSTVEADIKAKLLTGDDPLPVTLVAAYLTNLRFTVTFQASIDAKVVAQQDLIKAATEKEIAEVKANEAAAIQIILNEQNIAMAVAEATAEVTRAEGTAEAQELLKSVTVSAINEMYTMQFIDDVERAAFEADTSVGGFLTIQEISTIILEQLYYDTWDGVLPEVIAGADGLSIILPTE